MALDYATDYQGSLITDPLVSEHWKLAVDDTTQTAFSEHWVVDRAGNEWIVERRPESFQAYNTQPLYPVAENLGPNSPPIEATFAPIALVEQRAANVGRLLDGTPILPLPGDDPLFDKFLQSENPTDFNDWQRAWQATHGLTDFGQMWDRADPVMREQLDRDYGWLPEGVTNAFFLGPTRTLIETGNPVPVLVQIGVIAATYVAGVAFSGTITGGAGDDILVGEAGKDLLEHGAAETIPFYLQQPVPVSTPDLSPFYFYPEPGDLLRLPVPTPDPSPVYFYPEPGDLLRLPPPDPIPFYLQQPPPVSVPEPVPLPVPTPVDPTPFYLLQPQVPPTDFGSFLPDLTIGNVLKGISTALGLATTVKALAAGPTPTRPASAPPGTLLTRVPATPRYSGTLGSPGSQLVGFDAGAPLTEERLASGATAPGENWTPALLILLGLAGLGWAVAHAKA